MLFQAFYEKVEYLHPSGVPYQEDVSLLVCSLLVILHSFLLTLELCCRFFKHKHSMQSLHKKDLPVYSLVDTTF